MSEVKTYFVKNPGVSLSPCEYLRASPSERESDLVRIQSGVKGFIHEVNYNEFVFADTPAKPEAMKIVPDRSERSNGSELQKHPSTTSKLHDRSTSQGASKMMSTINSAMKPTSNNITLAGDRCTQEQIRNLQKQLKFRDQEYNKDKAIWCQRHELVSQQLKETEEQMEMQKLYYLQIISSLKLTSSPMKQPITIEIEKRRLSGNGTFDEEESFEIDALKIQKQVESALSFDEFVKGEQMIRDKASTLLKQEN